MKASSCTLIFIFLIANAESGQVLPTLKEATFCVVTHGAVNKNVRMIKSTWRTTLQIAKYCNKTGYSAAVGKFKSLLPDLNESTVCGFRKKYLHLIKLGEKRNRSLDIHPTTWKATTSRQWHWRKSDKSYNDFKLKGGQATFAIAIVVAKSLKEQRDNESLTALKFGNDWTQSLFRWMGFKKRAATIEKVIMPEGTREEAELIYLYDIVTEIETYNIPH